MADALNTPLSDLSATICTLKYCGAGSIVDSAGIAVLLAVQDHGTVKIYALRDMRQQIAETHWAYIDELLKDLVAQASLAPEAVFRQLCNLSAGPIITDSVRQVELDKLIFHDVYPGFNLCTS